MPERILRRHLLVTLALLMGATILLNASSRRRTVPLTDPLKMMPFTVGDWHGFDSPIAPRIVTAAGVDDYLSRVYTGPLGRQVDIYVGYYSSQRAGDLIHSPRNCLPAAGWDLVRTGRLVVAIPHRRAPIAVNEFIVAKGLQQDLILYWYQERGRAIPSEFMAKFWMVADALFRNRTDGAIVRITSSIENQESDARLQAVSFLRSIDPYLEKIVPE